MSEVQPNERFSRQRDIVPPERIADCKATVIGVGAIGCPVGVKVYIRTGYDIVRNVVGDEAFIANRKGVGIKRPAADLCPCGVGCTHTGINTAFQVTVEIESTRELQSR